MNKADIKIKLSVMVIKENDRFVAYSPALDLSTSGKTSSQARKRFSQAADIFFEEIIAKGTFENVLGDLGWKKLKTVWQPPKVISSDVQEFCVAA